MAGVGDRLLLHCEILLLKNYKIEKFKSLEKSKENKHLQKVLLLPTGLLKYE